MGRFVKNRELKSSSYAIRVPVGSGILAPNYPLDGQLRFNSVRHRLEMYDTNRWRPFAFSSEIEYPYKDTFYGTGYQTVFGPMRYKYPKGNEIFLQVFVFNVHQNPGVAYNIEDYTITFTSPPPDGHPIVVFHGMFAGDSLVPIPSSWQPPQQIYLPTSYRIIGNTNKVIEKDANLISFTVTTTNVDDGTVLFYRLRPGAIPITTPPDPSDFVLGNVMYLNNGSFTILSNIGSFNVEIQTDTIVEHDESFYVEVLTGNINGTVVASSVEYEIAMLDEIPKSYSISQDKYLVNEGDPVTFTVRTVKVPDATTVYYQVIPASVQPITYLDIVGGTNMQNVLVGTFTITSNIGSFQVFTAYDAVPDLGERFYVSLSEEAPMLVNGAYKMGNIVANSALVSIGWTFF